MIAPGALPLCVAGRVDSVTAAVVSSVAAVVSSVFATVVATVDAVGHDGGGADDGGSPGDGRTDDGATAPCGPGGGACQSPSVVASSEASSASSWAMMAWIGILPLAMSWPPARRAAEANGAAQRFSKTIAPAQLPLSIDAARLATSSADRISAISPSSARRSSTVSRSSISIRLENAVAVLVDDQQVEEPDRAVLDEGGEFGRHLTGEVGAVGRELDDEVVDRAELIEFVCHGTPLERVIVLLDRVSVGHVGVVGRHPLVGGPVLRLAITTRWEIVEVRRVKSYRFAVVRS